MLLRFGYVANATKLEDASPSTTITATNFAKVPEEERIARLTRIASQNLTNTIRILRYNAAYNVHVYRFTSKLIPLATHPLIADWDYVRSLRPLLKQMGEIVRKNHMRVSAHPDHFAVLNSPRKHILEDATADLEYQVALFEAMGLDEHAKMIVHVGGSYKTKTRAAKGEPDDERGQLTAMERFKTNVNGLPDSIRGRLVLENDDKSYTATDALSLGRELQIPVCLDVHHYRVNRTPDEALAELIPAIFHTWSDLPPKVHVSSPKNSKDIRSHADYVDPSDLADFLDVLRRMDDPPEVMDIMVEAKMKDQAMFKLVADLAKTPGMEAVDEANLVMK